MTTAVSTVLTKVSTLLHDQQNIRWPQTELLGWLNDGQYALANVAPSSCTKSQTNLILGGNSRQDLPPDAISLVSVVRNRGASGTSNGSAIRLIDREMLDSRYPNWHSMTASEVVGYVYNKSNPKCFYLWPMPGGGVSLYIEYEYVFLPAAAVQGGNVSIPDAYVEALINYILFRAHSKDTEEQAAQKAQLYYQAFVTSATQGGTAETRGMPEITPTNTVLNPNTAGHYAGKV